MDREYFINHYWNYYLMLENDFFKISRYVKVEEDNYDTYSDEIIKLIENIGAESDLIFKKICNIDLNKKSNIKEYSKLLDYYPKIKDEQLQVLYTNIIIKPFENWNKENPSKLFWWECYNQVKHNRENNYKKGNLFILINSLGALYYLEMYLCREIGNSTYDVDIPNIKSSLFNIINWQVRPSIKRIEVKEGLKANMPLDIEIPYIVGNNEIQIYCEGIKLILDGNYYEVGEKGKKSHYIRMNWDIKANYCIEINKI